MSKTKVAKPFTSEPTEPQVDPLVTYLEAVPRLERYRKLNPLEAYALQADLLRQLAAEAERAAMPVGSHAHYRYSAAARDTHQRAALCDAMASGAHITTALDQVLGPQTKTATDNNDEKGAQVESKKRRRA
jgi:hypothetical protein